MFIEGFELRQMAVNRAVDVAALAVKLAVVLPDGVIEAHFGAVEVTANGAFHLCAEEAVFTGEARRDAVERLKLIDKLELRFRVTAEERPCMYVALFALVGAVAEVRRGRHIRNERAVAVHGTRLNIVEYLLAIEALRLDGRREPIGVGFRNLVVACPDGHAGIMCKALCLVLGFALRLKEEIVFVVGVERAGVHKVMHQQNAVLRAIFIEAVRLIRAAAPHAEHGEVRRRALAHEGLVAFLRGAQIKGIRRHPVAALAEDAHAVHLKEEVAAAVFKLRGIELQGTDADLLRLHLVQDAFCDAAGFKGIEVLRTVAVRPPEFRVFDCDAFLGEVHAADEHERFFAGINGFTLKFERIGELALGA